MAKAVQLHSSQSVGKNATCKAIHTYPGTEIVPRYITYQTRTTKTMQPHSADHSNSSVNHLAGKHCPTLLRGGLCQVRRGTQKGSTKQKHWVKIAVDCSVAKRCPTRLPNNLRPGCCQKTLKQDTSYLKNGTGGHLYEL